MKNQKCPCDFILIDKWQEGKLSYYEFHCRYCLRLVLMDNGDLGKAIRMEAKKNEIPKL